VPSIAFVTGVDADMFGQLFLLLGSLRRNRSGVWLHVCDLGMTERQLDYLRRTGRLIQRPAGRGLPRHPWYDKAALGAYAEHLDAEVWAGPARPWRRSRSMRNPDVSPS
jgi:hypothetical protein